MKRLIQNGLMFGNLIEVSSPVLIDRYNRALQHLSGKTTALTDFHIDISGYSPEIGDELDDHLYLNPNGVNRQFILLTPDQKTAPLLGEKFSTTREVLLKFIDDNAAQLFALTAQDAVAGELENSVFRLDDPAKLLNIRKISVVADTTRSHVANAGELAQMIETFRTRDGAWIDDVLIARMIELAKTTGDVVRNPVILHQTEVETRSFWTSHFGGAYIFRGAGKTAILARDAAQFAGVPADAIYDLTDQNAIARFLDANDLAEPIVKARNVNAAAILRQKMEFILIDAAVEAGVTGDREMRRNLRTFARMQGARLPEAYRGLADLMRWLEADGTWPRISSHDPSYFYLLRATQGPDRNLVNRLLAELTPLDIRQLFICHKPLFYELYATWPDAKKDFVVDFLVQEYQMDKAGARAALFGPEPGMDIPSPQQKPEPKDDILDIVGPWGAVRRMR